jgi:predicted ATPase
MTDVVGSTALWESYEPVMPAVLERHDEIVHGAVAAVGGRVFKHTGDGMIAVFDDAEPAIAAAQDACAGLAAESWVIPGEVRIRSSLHAGPVTERDGDFFGPVLNRVARINGVAHPDQIVASGLVHQLLAEPMGIDLGEHQLRDLGEPVRLWQLDDGSHPPLKSMRADLNNLPVQLTEFIGRQAEVERLAQLLAEHRLVTISGMGGCGKTRIALEVSADVSARFDGGVWLADLRSAADADDVVQQIAVAIGLATGGQPRVGGQLADLIVEYADRSPTLVVLDNCEHLVDDAADVAGELLRGSQNLTILATSREALGTEGERVWRIPSMGAESGEACDLFLARATAANSDFEVDPDGVELVDRICTQLDGIPLAIELAAARVGHLSLSELEAGLDERFALLSGGRRARRQRQQTLQAMMDWSWELLDADEQTMLTELSVFRGGFDARGVDAVCARPEMGTRFDVLTGLVDRSLVQVAADGGSMSRYQLLETVRLYGLDRLAAAGTTSDVRDRHAAWVRRENSCHVTARTGFDPDEALYWMRNADNLLAAAEWLAESGDIVAAAEVMSGRASAFYADHNVDGVRWFTREFVEDARLPDDVALAVSLTAAHVALFSGDYLAGGSFLRGGLDRLDQFGDVTGLSDVVRSWGAALCGLAAMQVIAIDLERARSFSMRAAELSSTLDVPLGARFLAGLIAQIDGDFENAVELTSFEATEPAWYALPGYSSLRIVHAASLSSLDRHDEAVAATRAIPTNALLRSPNSTFAVRVAWVLLRAGLAQEALDLIARPTRFALGLAIDQWRFGRSLVLAEYVIDRDPGLAARLLGCASVSVTMTLGPLRDEVLTRARAVLGDRIDDLLAQGAADGEESTVAEAHAIIRADGLNVD